MKTAALSYRLACLQDEAFLLELYCSNRRQEIADWGWNTQQQEAFLRMQFYAQQKSYFQSFPEGDRQIIVIGQQPIGSIFLSRKAQEIQFVDLALFPDAQNQGIGTFVLKSLLSEATAERKSVVLQVSKSNRATQLYLRLGFVKYGETDTHYSMAYLNGLAIALAAH
jgi:ribosomal protein S18 acetylase RimI-like enzyme